METDETQLVLAGLAADLIEEISLARALEMSGLPARVMGPREHEVARHANPDYQKLRGIPPLDPGARKWCGYCGNSDPDQLVPGPDHEHGFNDWMCKDSLDRHCQARHERRWPPMPSRAEPVLMKLARQADEAQAARQVPRPAPQPEQQQEPAQQEPAKPPVPGWQFSPFGSIDPFGSFHPAMQASPLSHLISGGASMSHAISGGQQHMGHTISGIARGRAQGQVPAGGVSGQQEPQRDTSTGIPPEGPPPGQQEGELAQSPGWRTAPGAPGQQVGIDSQVIPPRDPAAVTRRPARDRFGSRRKLRYQGRR